MILEPVNQLPLEALFARLCAEIPDGLEALIRRALREDGLGNDGPGDLTSASLIPADARGEGVVRARGPGRLAGVRLLPRIAQAAGALELDLHIKDGDKVAAGETVGVVRGPLRGLLAAERTILNFLGHLSGVATLTAAFVERVASTSARIYDTRKTTPGLRALEKYAVRCGGGFCHRLGLHDAMLIKDNHLASIPAAQRVPLLRRAIAQVRGNRPEPSFVAIEADDLDQVRSFLDLDVDILLLDNFTPDLLAQAVELRNRLGHRERVELEASGGITLQTVSAVARTGVERISVGALTHSAAALDVGLDVGLDPA